MTIAHMEELSEGIIYKTTNYDQFKKILGNRDLNPGALRRLQGSLAQCNLLHVNPIIVTPDMEVIDGQHRLEICRQNGWPVHYVIEDTAAAESVINLNANQKRWEIKDYVKYYSDKGNESYRKIERAAKEHGIATSAMVVWFTKANGEGYEKVRDGTLTLSPESQGALYFAMQLMAYWRSLKASRIVLNSVPLQRALKMVLTHPEVDGREFVDKVKKHGLVMKREIGKLGYTQALIDMYNYCRRSKRLMITGHRLNFKIKVVE